MANGNWVGMVGDVRFTRLGTGEIFWNLKGNSGRLCDLDWEDFSAGEDWVIAASAGYPKLPEEERPTYERLMESIQRYIDNTPPVVVREIVEPNEVIAPSKGAAAAAATGGCSVVMVPLDLIDESPYQVETTRGKKDSDPEIVELAESIKASGGRLVQPVVLRDKKSGRFELIAGHRRCAATRIAGFAEVMAVVREMSDVDARFALAVENLQRKNLSPIGEALSVESMMSAARAQDPDKATGDIVGDIARKIGKSTRWVYRRESITRLTEGWKKKAVDNGLSAAFLERVARLPGETQEEVLKSFGSEWAGDGLERGGDIAALDDQIEISLRKISSAPWAGVAGDPAKCAGCADRSDARPDIFEDMETEPRCLNKACWEKRVDAWVKTAAAQAKKACGKVIEATSTAAYLYSDKKDSEHGVPVVITAGAKRGTIMWAPSEKQAEEKKAGPEKKKARPDKNRLAYVSGVRACLECSAKPEWKNEDGSVKNIGTAVLVAFAIGCGTNPNAVVTGPFDPVSRSREIMSRMSADKNDLKVAMDAALWDGLKPKLCALLDTQGIDGNTECIEAEKTARMIVALLGIPKQLVDKFSAAAKF